MKVLGIDEAGRGCVIGPLVLCGVVIDEEHLAGLLDLGVRDSKRLLPKRRESLCSRIIEVASTHSLRIIEPSRIDEASLNFLEAEEIASLIKRFSPQKVFFDVPTHPAGVSNFVKSVRAQLATTDISSCHSEFISESPILNQVQDDNLENIEIIGENKADEKFPVVSAASILAKVERDRIVSELRKEYGDFGSGYLSDSKTQDFLSVWFGRFGDFPPIVRRKWSSVQRFLAEQQKLL